MYANKLWFGNAHYKMIFLVSAGLLMLGGCASQTASLAGHDFIDSALANIKVGIDEYHADDAQRIKQVKAKLAAAFAADIVSAGGDPNKVSAKTTEFIAAMNSTDSSADVERLRHQNLTNSIKALTEVNGSLRNLTQVRLGWQADIVEYTNRLRSKITSTQTAAAGQEAK
jgi:hypothetical protein